MQFEQVAGPQLRWTNDWDKADFLIAPTHMHCDNMLDGQVIVAVKRFNTLIGLVKDRRAIIAKDFARVVPAPAGR